MMTDSNGVYLVQLVQHDGAKFGNENFNFFEAAGGWYRCFNNNRNSDLSEFERPPQLIPSISALM